MIKKQTNSFSSVISVNPYNNEYILNTSNILSKTKSPQYAKEQFAVSFLNTKSYINNSTKISKNIPDDDILDAINTKIYDELNLDQAIEYQIQYIEIEDESDDENRTFQVFIVNPSDIEESYKNTIEKINYIDVITPVPLLIKSLYSKAIIEDDGIHCFIYFQENDSFISIYNERDFVYAKSLKYSFLDMHERFCELYGERVEYSEFTKFLSTQNLKTTNSPYKEFIFKLYKEIFSGINDVLTYTKKAFNIEKVQQIYIGSQIEFESKLHEIAEVELIIKSENFNFNYGFENSEKYIDQIQSLMQITNDLDDDEKYICNFSTFHRPPKFIKRESGKLLLTGLISLVIAFSYPITYWTLIYMEELKHSMFQDEYNAVHIQKTTREDTLKMRTSEKNIAVKLLEKEKVNYIDKKNTLIQIHDVKVNYPMKAKLITDFTKDLNKYSIKIKNISYSQNDKKKHFTLNLVSKKDNEITHFIKYMTEKYENKFTFSLEKITYDKDNKFDFSELKVYIL